MTCQNDLVDVPQGQRSSIRTVNDGDQNFSRTVEILANLNLSDPELDLLTSLDVKLLYKRYCGETNTMANECRIPTGHI